jgi:hypothetical protein
MLVVQFYQLHPKATRFLSDLITEIFGPSEIKVGRDGYCDIQFNGVRVSQQRILLEKFKATLGIEDKSAPPELKYQNGEIAPNRNAKLNIWYTGENIRPPLHLEYDYFLSFDQDDYSGRNIYFPLWYLDLDWGFGEKFCPRIGIDVKGVELSTTRDYNSEKSGFACAFLGHIHPIRYEAIRQLAQLGIVDVFGRAVGKPVDSKFSIARRYRYTVCFENDIYPGYVTEKLLDAYYCETVPVYWGDLGKQDVINNESHLNLQSFSSLETFKERIAAINDEDYNTIYSQPFLKKLPNLTRLKDALVNGV